MKRIFTIVAMTFLWIVSMTAQVPQKLTYQAVIRDAIGDVITNQDLEVQISILQGSVEGPVVYSESHTTCTTVNGVITLEVGGGNTSYDFTSIDWSNGPYYIRSTAELNGKNISVTSQLLSVPYALYAQRSFFANKVDEQFLEDIINAKIQSALDEKEAEWQSKIEALEAALDSISAQLSVPPIDTVPSDTIPTDTIPTDTLSSDTTHADTVGVDTTFKSAAKHGVLPGKFSMGENYQVHFSKGMLQYLAYKNVWRFAKTQFDVIDKRYRDYWMYPAEGWTDKFQYDAGTVDHPDCTDDWFREYMYYDPPLIEREGFQAPIHNGGNKDHVWRTPSFANWMYLIAKRDNASNLFSKAEVAGVKGFVFLPDDWETPSDLTFTPKAENCSVNVYDKKTWERMEALGAVFIAGINYWSWNEWYGEWTAFLVDVNAEYAADCEDIVICWPNYIRSDISCSTDLSYRLVIPDSTAKEIMDGEALENEDLDGLETNRPNNYLPESNPDLSGVDMKAGLLNGRFSVSETKQVNFSQGNLQYNSELKVWRFGETQYDLVGAYTSGRDGDGWIDIFRWASSGYACDPMQDFSYGSFGADTLSDVSGTKYDWGVYNPIVNGGNTPNIWRTLSRNEWIYLLNREKDGRKFYAPARVGGVDGMLLLPDDWDFNSDLPVVQKPNSHRYVFQSEDNIYSDSLWARMEAQGAVFLSSPDYVCYQCHYFSPDDYRGAVASFWSLRCGVMMYYSEDYSDEHFDIQFNGSMGNGYSVRLVRDVTE